MDEPPAAAPAPEQRHSLSLPALVQELRHQLPSDKHGELSDIEAAFKANPGQTKALQQRLVEIAGKEAVQAAVVSLLKLPPRVRPRPDADGAAPASAADKAGDGGAGESSASSPGDPGFIAMRSLLLHAAVCKEPNCTEPKCAAMKVKIVKVRAFAAQRRPHHWRPDDGRTPPHAPPCPSRSLASTPSRARPPAASSVRCGRTSRITTAASRRRCLHRARRRRRRPPAIRAKVRRPRWAACWAASAAAGAAASAVAVTILFWMTT